MTNDETDLQSSEGETLLNTNGAPSRLSFPSPKWPPGVKFQLGLVIAMQLAEPLNGQSINPYINQLIMELGITQGDPKKVGYYAGLISSFFFLAEALTILQWSRTSDHIGRKPVLLIGLVGMSISMLCFGLSRSFPALVICRAMSGILNGNTGVMKSVLGDLTSPANRADAFSWIPIAWGIGVTVGPLIGGTLSKPYEHWKAFDTPFWKSFPYFLPALVIASYSLVAGLSVVFFFKESNPRTKKTALEAENGPITYGTITSMQVDERPPPFRETLTYPVVFSIANYILLAFLEIMILSFIPLFCALPTEVGGLNLPPSIIGIAFASYGFATGVIQILLFPRFMALFGVKKLYVWGIGGFVPMCFLFPAMSLWAKAYGVTMAIWVMYGMVMLGLCMQDFAYGAIFVYVTASVPNKKALGATNGLAQTMASFIRAIGPALVTSTYSFSLEYNILGGYVVYVFLFAMCIGALVLGSRMPEKAWDELEKENDPRTD